jgi:hypothetical protein
VNVVAVLVVVLLIIVGLSWRAGLYRSRYSVSGSEAETQTQETDCGFLDTCARTFVLVFLCLAGLLALGVMYGNVLGAHASP